MQQEVNVFPQFKFYIIFTNVISIIAETYDLSKIHNKIPKYSQTSVSIIIIYQVSSIQLYLAFELYPS